MRSRRAILGRSKRTLRSGAREVSAAGDEEKDVISIRHNDGRESRIIGSRSDGAFKVCLETEKRKIDIDLSASMPSLSSRLLWSVLDVLAGDTYPRLWVATKEGSVGGNRPGRDFDPAPTDALEIVRLLEAAQRSYSSRQAVML